jgi:hypothetical protein
MTLRSDHNREAFVQTMVKLAFRCPAFMWDEGDKMTFSPQLDGIIASGYYFGRKGIYKQVFREIRGQLMQITDRRQQYYAKRQAYDERMNFLASAYGLSRPQPDTGCLIANYSIL